MHYEPLSTDQLRQGGHGPGLGRFRHEPPYRGAEMVLQNNEPARQRVIRRMQFEEGNAVGQKLVSALKMLRDGHPGLIGLDRVVGHGSHAIG